jgi:cytochrome P450
MIGFILLGVAWIGLIIRLVAIPLVKYLRDPKGLRRFPNFSLFSGITDIAFVIESHKGFRSKAQHAAHKLNPIIRIGPNSLSFGDVRAIDDIYGHSTKCTKDIMYTLLGGTHTHLIDSVDNREHSEKRKRLSAAFAIKNLEGWEYKVAEKTSKLINAFDEKCTSQATGSHDVSAQLPVVIDFNQWVNLFTIDAIGLIAMSADLGLIEQGDDTVKAQRRDGSIYTARYRKALNSTALAQSSWIWSYEKYTVLRAASFLSPRFRELWRTSDTWNDILHYHVTERLRRHQRGEKLDDFFTSLMENKSGMPNNLEWGEIVAEMSAILNAGSDTTAIALTNVMYNLVRNPRCLQRLREEVDSVLDDDETISPHEKVRHLPYLRACLDESLRIIPPSSFGLPRRTPPEGATILGEWIPGDTSVSIPAYVAHRDEKIFTEPESYIPERWLREDAREMQPSFIPFSAGARGCIGRNISYLEQTIVLASIVRRYDFSMPSPDFELKYHEAFNILVGELPLEISFRRR